jgi:hypothetical protein
MSYETTMARASARDADETWQHHRRGCHQCEPAARKRRPAGLCPEGQGMLSLRDELREKAAREAELDKTPHPDQGALWSSEDLPARVS